MRFELSAENVHQLINMMYTVISSVDKYDITSLNALSAFLRKLQAYSLEAFENREKFRSEMKSLKKEIDELFEKYGKK